jgi:hypothetical protein
MTIRIENNFGRAVALLYYDTKVIQNLLLWGYLKQNLFPHPTIVAFDARFYPIPPLFL